MFVINTILWYPFVELHGLDVLDEQFILDNPEDLPDVENFINNSLITVLRDYHIKSSKMNYAISEVLYNLRKISIDYSLIIGLDFSIPLFINLYNEIPRIKELMECHFDETMQPHEIEQTLSGYQKEYVEIVTGLKDNHLGIALRANTGIKHKKLCRNTEMYWKTYLIAGNSY